jgi:hypothetical protein
MIHLHAPNMVFHHPVTPWVAHQHLGSNLDIPTKKVASYFLQMVMMMMMMVFLQTYLVFGNRIWAKVKK